MTNQSPPMGRMLMRALESYVEPEVLTEDQLRERINLALQQPSLFRWNITFIDNSKPGRSLNTTGVQFRVRQLQWDCIRLRKGLGELYTPEEQNAHLAKPVTKKDILDGYLRAGHYFNNSKPRV